MFEIGTATDHADLLEKLHVFLTTNGSAYGLTYAGTGNGTLTAYRGGASSVAETFAITATSATNFTVVGSVSGSIGPATVGTPFSHAKIAFTLTAGGTAFVAGDVFALSTAPKWTTNRRARGCGVTSAQGATGQAAAENVIDGKVADGLTGLSWIFTGGVPFDIEFLFYEAETIVQYAINCPDATSNLNAWTFDYWNGSAWVNLDTRTAQTGWGSTEVRAFTVASPVSNARYRIRITAVNGAGANWYVALVNLRRAAGGFGAEFSQYLWQAPGNNGTSQIFLGGHHFRRLDIDYYNLEFAAFDGYNAASSWRGQPGAQDKSYVPLLSTSMPYWFVVNGQRAIVVVKSGSQYECAYLGFYNPYFTPAQLPYPIALGGSMAFGVGIPLWNNALWRWSNLSNDHRAFTHSDTRGTSTLPGAQVVQMRARTATGAWRGFVASDSDNFRPSTSNIGLLAQIWPYHGDFSLMDPNLDGTYSLFPVMLHDTLSPSPNAMGELDGVFALSGQGVTAETLVRQGVRDHLVIPNINRVDRQDWLAVGLD